MVSAWTSLAWVFSPNFDARAFFSIGTGKYRKHEGALHGGTDGN